MRLNAASNVVEQVPAQNGVLGTNCLHVHRGLAPVVAVGELAHKNGSGFADKSEVHDVAVLINNRVGEIIAPASLRSEVDNGGVTMNIGVEGNRAIDLVNVVVVEIGSSVIRDRRQHLEKREIEIE